MFTNNLLVLPIVLPLFAAFITPIVARLGEVWARALGPTIAVINLLLGFWIFMGTADAVGVTAMSGIAAPVGIVLYGDRLAAIFVMALALGVLLFWPKDEQGGERGRMLMLLLLAGGSGLVLSGDLFNIFVFYEITAVASYGLASSGGGRAGFAAALRYLLLSALASSMLLLGIALIYAKTGSLNLADLARLAPTHLQGPLGLTAFVLLLVGFGVKAELFPVNSWVPEVYSAAPMKVTALLAGIVSKLAMVVILRLMVLLFDSPSASLILIVVGIAGIVAGELAAYRSRDLNRLFAFSSIGQLGMVAVAVAIPGPAGLAAALAVMLHHAVVKPAFFNLAERWHGPITSLTGGAKAAPLAGALFVFLTLSIVGVPPLPGFWAKMLVLMAAFQAGPMAAFAAFVILTATVVEAAYLMRVIQTLYTAGDGAPRVAFGQIRPALWLGAGLIVATLFIAPLGDLVRQTAASAADAPAYISAVLPQPTGGA